MTFELSQALIDDAGKRKPATIARRPAELADLTDGTCTPRWLTDLLPERDFDPCSNQRSTVRARDHIMLCDGRDGLAEPWPGEGFINWPFSSPMPWCRKARQEIAMRNCTDLIVLCKLDPGTRWWRVITEPSSHVRLERWELFKRVQYVEHPDIVEERRREQAIKRAAKLTAAGKDPYMTPAGKPRKPVTGKSQANFVSVILHLRGNEKPRLRLEGVAQLWLPVESCS